MRAARSSLKGGGSRRSNVQTRVRYRSRLGDEIVNRAIFEPAPGAKNPFLAMKRSTIAADDADLREALRVRGLALA